MAAPFAHPLEWMPFDGGFTPRISVADGHYRDALCHDGGLLGCTQGLSDR
jgi:hypothetical protein